MLHSSKYFKENAQGSSKIRYTWKVVWGAFKIADETQEASSLDCEAETKTFHEYNYLHTICTYMTGTHDNNIKLFGWIFSWLPVVEQVWNTKQHRKQRQTCLKKTRQLETTKIYK